MNDDSEHQHGVITFNTFYTLYTVAHLFNTTLHSSVYKGIKKQTMLMPTVSRVAAWATTNLNDIGT